MKERLKQFIESQQLNVTQFEVKISATRGTIARFLREDCFFSAEILVKISYTYPFLNLDWLITGRGSMIYGESRVERVAEKKHGEDATSVPLVLYRDLQDRYDVLQGKYEDKVETIGRLKATIEGFSSSDCRTQPTDRAIQKKRGVHGDC